jgi:hypothetical protein
MSNLLVPVSEGPQPPKLLQYQLVQLLGFASFISYNHSDKAFARLLYDTLQGRGIRCWLDEKQLLPGDIAADVIRTGLRLRACNVRTKAAKDLQPAGGAL